MCLANNGHKRYNKYDKNLQTIAEKIPNNEMTMDYREEIGKSNMIIYTTEDGLSKIETIFDGDTVWLSKAQMAELFQRDRSVISKYIKIYLKKASFPEKVMCKFCTLQIPISP